MPKVTSDRINELMGKSEFRSTQMFDKTTVVSCKLPNGFVISESSSCVDPKDYDHELGVHICKKRIENRLWELEGYLAQHMMAMPPVGARTVSAE
jgi:hypothetical protein